MLAALQLELDLSEEKSDSEESTVINYSKEQRTNSANSNSITRTQNPVNNLDIDSDVDEEEDTLTAGGLFRPQYLSGNKDSDAKSVGSIESLDFSADGDESDESSDSDNVSCINNTDSDVNLSRILSEVSHQLGGDKNSNMHRKLMQNSGGTTQATNSNSSNGGSGQASGNNSLQTRWYEDVLPFDDDEESAKEDC